VEGYPRLQNLQRMLILIDRIIKEAAREELNPEVEVHINRSGRDAGVTIFYMVGDPQTEDFFTGADRPVGHHLARELGLGGGETVGLFRWAESEGYIRPNYGALGRDYGDWKRGTLEHLQSKGYELIGELPDPQEHLARILDAAIQVVQRDASLDPQEKKRRIDWFEEAKFVVRTFGVEVAKSVLRGEIPPM
jgi:hypothetical protein